MPRGEKPPVPEDLSRPEKSQLWRWAKRNFPKWATKDRIEYVVGETLDHWGSVGNPRGYTNWVRVVQNRIRQLEMRGWDPCSHLDRGDRERPQERGPRSRQTELLADVIQLPVGMKR